MALFRRGRGGADPRKHRRGKAAALDDEAARGLSGAFHEEDEAGEAYGRDESDGVDGKGFDYSTDEWSLYERGVEYKRRLGLYEAVDEAEANYAGDQWRGVDAGGLPTPVFNIFKRVGNYFIAQILSQSVRLQFSPEGITQQGEDGQFVRQLTEQLNRYVEYRWERDKMQARLGDALRDAAISGDAFLYVYWDPDIQTGQAYTGDFVTELVDNVNVHFGDPNTAEVERQPYILISGRDTVDSLRREARAAGSPDADGIEPDMSDRHTESGDLSQIELEDTKTTYVIKFWRREDGGISWKKSTRGAVIRRETDLGIRRYPVAYMNWDKRKGSYHGRGFVTGQIQNQRYINKAFALLMQHMLSTSFSKIVYDANRIETWSPAIGEAVPVAGEVGGAAQAVGTGSFQAGYMQAIELATSMTRDFLGATDAALGNVRPDNTSAIIAVQQASSVPLENIKRSLYQMIEDMGLIWLEYMLSYYGDGRVLPCDAHRDGNAQEKDGEAVSLSACRDQIFGVRVDVGPSYYWSELACIASLDNLLARGVINPVEYLERMPDTVIPRRRELLEAKRAELGQAMQGRKASGDGAAQARAMMQAAEGGAASAPAGMQADLPAEAGTQTQAEGGADMQSVLAALPPELRVRLLSLPAEAQGEALRRIMQP